jgi:hypothetical protein
MMKNKDLYIAVGMDVDGQLIIKHINEVFRKKVEGFRN